MSVYRLFPQFLTLGLMIWCVNSSAAQAPKSSKPPRVLQTINGFDLVRKINAARGTVCVVVIYVAQSYRSNAPGDYDPVVVCEETVTELAGFLDRFHPADVTVIACGFGNSPDIIARFLTKYGGRLDPLLLEIKSPREEIRAMQQIGITFFDNFPNFVLPHTVVFNREGKVVKQFAKYIDRGDFRDMVEPYIGVSKAPKTTSTTKAASAAPFPVTEPQIRPLTATEPTTDQATEIVNTDYSVWVAIAIGAGVCIGVLAFGAILWAKNSGGPPPQLPPSPQSTNQPWRPKV